MSTQAAGDVFVLLKCEAQNANPEDYEFWVQDALDSTGHFDEGHVVVFDGFGHFVRPVWAKDHAMGGADENWSWDKDDVIWDRPCPQCGEGPLDLKGYGAVCPNGHIVEG